MRARLLVALVAGVLLVPWGAAPAGADVFTDGYAERRDTVVIRPDDGSADVECQVLSRQRLHSDGTLTISTSATQADPSDAAACTWPAVAWVRYTYRDEDGDLQSGEAVAPRGAVVTLPAAGVSELRSYHRVVWYDEFESPEFPLPK